jgi:CheY-like chemotaxis protein
MEAAEKPVLVVDDEEIVRDSVTEWLKSEGYNVDSAEDGLEALKKIKEGEYDVVVLDMKLPGMDGLAVLRQVHETNPDIKVIIITAYASVETAVQALKAGAVDYIIKPFEPEKLEASVAKWIGRPRITLGAPSTETSSPEEAEVESAQALTSVLEKTKELLDGGNPGEALAMINEALGAAPAVVETPAPATAPEVLEEEKVAARPKVKPGKYFPPHFWEGCFSYICGKDTCPFTAECFAAQGKHQRETEKFIESVNQILLDGGAPSPLEQAEVDHAVKYHGAQFDSKQGIYVINKAALKNRPGLGGAYFR